VTVLHVHCVSLNAVYAMAAQRALKLPLVVTLHGELTMDSGGLFQRERWAQQTLRDSLRKADRVTACSERTLVEAEEWFGGPLRAKGEVIHNGIALEPHPREPHQHPRPYVLAIGRHVAQKGFDVLLRALAQLRDASLPEFDLILAGDGPEHANLRTLAAELGLAGRVHFPGRVDHDEALRLFAGCMFFVLPSRLEPFGLVNLEAMAAGRAVVASGVGGVPEVVLHGQTGFLVPPDDVNALARTIRQVAASPSLRQYLGGAGKERVKSFAWSAAVDRYFGVYKRVLGRQTPREFAMHKEAA
ncbi:MAG: glycosyltransferase family 4 protein, partial [Rhodospirillales bacterium]|nr:glycosyltransferase family 4 protein [Acetobacter sp.]